MSDREVPKGGGGWRRWRGRSLAECRKLESVERWIGLRDMNRKQEDRQTYKLELQRRALEYKP